jgi:hypothetical protein
MRAADRTGRDVDRSHITVLTQTGLSSSSLEREEIVLVGCFVIRYTATHGGQAVRIASLYDIHGNVPALRAVISEIGGVDVILVGGDVVWGPWPQETMDLLRSVPNVEFIMGNADRDVFNRSAGKWKHTNDWCADRLTEDHLAFLRSRPATFSNRANLVLSMSRVQDRMAIRMLRVAPSAAPIMIPGRDLSAIRPADAEEG